MIDSPFTTTRKIRTKIGQLFDRVRAAGAAFDAAYSKYDQTHTKEAREAMMEAHKALMDANKEYTEEYKRLDVRRFEKMEGSR